MLQLRSALMQFKPHSLWVLELILHYLLLMEVDEIETRESETKRGVKRGSNAHF